MYRSSQQTSVNSADKQKQKKRLSFREPEAEVVQSLNKNSGGNLYNKTSQAKAYALMPKTERRRHSASLEDLSLEDQVMQIVHNVGQAFEKQTSEKPKLNCIPSDYLDNISKKKRSSFLPGFQQKVQRSEGDGVAELNSCDTVNHQSAAAEQKYLESLSSSLADTTARNSSTIVGEACTPMIKNAASVLGVVMSDQSPVNSSHQMQLMKYQLEQQNKQAQAALDHIQLLKDQLDAESAARYKAQAQCHQLLKQNKDLLDHVQSLFKQIQELQTCIVKLQHKSPDSQFVSRTMINSNPGMHQEKMNMHPMKADSGTPHYNAYLCNGGSVIKPQNPHSTINSTDTYNRQEKPLLKIEDSYPSLSDHVQSIRQGKPVETNNSHVKSKFSEQVKCTSGSLVPNVSTMLSYNTAGTRNALPIYSSASIKSNGTTQFPNRLSDHYNGNTFKADKSLVIEEQTEPGNNSSASKHEIVDSRPTNVSALQLRSEQPLAEIYSGSPKPLTSFFSDYVSKPLHCTQQLSDEQREKALEQLQGIAQW